MRKKTKVTLTPIQQAILGASVSPNAGTNRLRFGKNIKQLDEKGMLALEEKIPELAVGAIKQAYCQALASGATVLEAINGELVETKADGSRRFIKTLPPTYKVTLGAKRYRRDN